MIEHFVLTAVLIVLFVVGWGLLYESFYKGAFFNNNGGAIGGFIVTLMAFMMIGFPPYFAYLLLKSGIIWVAIKNFLVVGFWVSLALLFVFSVLGVIKKIEKKYLEKTNN